MIPNQPPHNINHSLQSIQSNHTSFTFQGPPANIRYNSRESTHNNNVSFNVTDISSIRAPPPHPSSNQNYSQDMSINTSILTAAPQGYYNSFSQQSGEPAKFVLRSELDRDHSILAAESSPPSNPIPRANQILPANIDMFNAQNSQSIYIPTSHPPPQLRQPP